MTQGIHWGTKMPVVTDGLVALNSRGQGNVGKGLTGVKVLETLKSIVSKQRSFFMDRMHLIYFIIIMVYNMHSSHIWYRKI